MSPPLAIHDDTLLYARSRLRAMAKEMAFFGQALRFAMREPISKSDATFLDSAFFSIGMCREHASEYFYLESNGGYQCAACQSH
jgi:hypothetical protein